MLLEFDAFVSPIAPQNTGFGDDFYAEMPAGYHVEVVTPPQNVSLDFSSSPSGWRIVAPAMPQITNDGIEDGFQFRFTDGVNHGETQTVILWLLVGN